jgi:hypothetical protein
MTQATHTPGPWAIFDNSGLTLKRSVTVTIGNRKIAFYNGDNFADAHLIAAAPDMLAALETISGKISSYHDADHDDAQMHIIADIEATLSAAIAKARGEG